MSEVRNDASLSTGNVPSNPETYLLKRTVTILGIAAIILGAYAMVTFLAKGAPFTLHQKIFVYASFGLGALSLSVPLLSKGIIKIMGCKERQPAEKH